MADMSISDEELETLIEITKDPGSTFVYHTDKTSSIEDFDEHVECWGNTHVLENKSKRSMGSQRTVYVYEFRCGRKFQTEYQRRRPELKNIESKPTNSCPGCSPSMDEIGKW